EGGNCRKPASVRHFLSLEEARPPDDVVANTGVSRSFPSTSRERRGVADYTNCQTFISLTSITTQPYGRVEAIRAFAALRDGLGLLRSSYGVALSRVRAGRRRPPSRPRPDQCRHSPAEIRLAHPRAAGNAACERMIGVLDAKTAFCNRGSAEDEHPPPA